MTNVEMRSIVDRLDIDLFKINYKTGVHYHYIEDFFGGKSDELRDEDRVRIEKMLEAELKKAEKK